MADIERIGVVIDIDGTKYEAGLKKAGDETERFGKKGKSAFSGMKQSWSELNQALEVGQKTFRVLNGTIGAAVRTAAQFEKRIAEIKTIARGAAFDVENLSQASKDMASQFGSTASEQAAGFYEAISSGAASTSEAVDLMTAANKLAVGGLTDAKTAVDGLTTILNSYGLKAKDSTDVTDAMFAAIEKGKLKAEDLARNMGTVASVANAVGVSFDTTLAAMAAVTAQGVRTETAASGLRQAFVNILKPTDDAAGFAKSLGIEFNITALRAQGLQGFLAEVTKKTGGSQEAIAKLFPDVDGLNAILKLTGEQGAKIFNESLDVMAQRAGKTDNAVNIMADTTDMQLNRMISAFDKLKIAVGEAFNLDFVFAHWTKRLDDIAESVDRKGLAKGFIFASDEDVAQNAKDAREDRALGVRKNRVSFTNSRPETPAERSARIETEKRVAKELAGSGKKGRKRKPVRNLTDTGEQFMPGDLAGFGALEFEESKKKDTESRLARMRENEDKIAAWKEENYQKELEMEQKQQSEIDKAQQKANAFGATMAGAIMGSIASAKNFGDAVSGIFEQLAMQAATNLLGKGIGSLLGIIPGGSIIGALFGAHGGKIPEFATGGGPGIIGGRATGRGIGPDNTLAMVQGGEALLSRPMTKALADTLGVRQPAQVGQGANGGGSNVTIIHQSMGEVTRTDARNIANKKLQPAFERNDRNRMRTSVFNRTPGAK